MFSHFFFLRLSYFPVLLSQTYIVCLQKGAGEIFVWAPALLREGLICSDAQNAFARMHKMVLKGNKLLPLVWFRVKSSLQSGYRALGQAMLCYEFERLRNGETQPHTETGINIFQAP